MSQRKVFSVFSFLPLLLFLLSGSVEAQLNVAVIVAEERGGTGDITSNLMAAMQLKKLNPNWNVFLVGPEYESSVAIVNNVLSPTQQKILLDGIPYYTRKQFEAERDKITGEANIALQFSTTTNSTMRVKTWADREAYFMEYSMEDDLNQWKSRLSFERDNDKYFSSGPGSLGMYINLKKPAALQNFAETMDSLTKVREKSVYAGSGAGQSRMLAYSYATHSANSRKYAELVYHAARTSLSEKSVRLVIYDPDMRNAGSYSVGKPENVELVVLHRRPLSLGFNLIAHADLPVLLTGDFGPTVAIDYEKPFFMETHSHKEKFRDELTKKFNRYVRTETSKTARVLDFNLLTLDDREIINDTKYWEKFSGAIGKFRSEISMVERLSNEINKFVEIKHCLGIGG